MECGLGEGHVLCGPRMQGEDFGGKENAWERVHRAQNGVLSGVQPGEGKVRPPPGSAGLEELRTGQLEGDCPRDVEQGRPPESETRHW